MRRIFAATIFLIVCHIPASAQSSSQIPPPANVATQEQQSKPTYLDPNLPIEQRVNDLVSRMTLEEKVSQMQNVAPAIPRLGIPAYDWWNEALHGVARAGNATVFPQAIGLAATWDTGLMHGVADVISTEARAKYNDAQSHGNMARYYGLTFWSPNINIFRDPRWGRGQETYGEDPFLTARMGVAFVTGMQGDDLRYLKAVSTPKHYAVHSGPEPSRHAFDVPVSPHDFADTYTPAFRATIVEGHADSVMCAYNSVLGEPACANKFLFGKLRRDWGFGGYVVSDCGAVSDIYQFHSFAADGEQAAADAVKAGTDLSCGTEYRALTAAVHDQLVSEAEIDASVKRLFTERFRLGMFDPPEMVPWSKLTIADDDTSEHRALALQAARESIVLLKNDRGTLPLPRSVKTIAVIGPNADSLNVLLGNYNGTPSRYTTFLEGIRERFAGAKILYDAGSPVTELDAMPIPASALRTGGPRSQPGLTAVFYNGTDLSGEPVLERIDPQINFEWDGAPPAPQLRGTNFSVRWNGELVAPEDGDYLIGGSSDDGFRLFFEGEKIVDDWSVHGERTRTATVHLVGGQSYGIVFEYYQAAGGSAARLLWSPPRSADQVLEVARKADVIVAIVGITPQLEGEEMATSAPGFSGGDRTNLDLPRPQQEMLEELAATGKPLVVVLTGGSALAVNWAQERAAAVLEMWYPGEEGGRAVVDVLTGDYNPSGRLPVTFYTGVSQLPPFDDYSMAQRTYRYFSGTPLYPFGFGLSYTNFTYTNTRVDHEEITATGAVTVSVDVKNSGAVAGDEVVQLYLSHPGVQGAPIRALEGFTRVHLAPGEQKTVSLTLRDRQLSVVDEAGKTRIVPGTVDVWIGGGQPVAGVGQSPPPGMKTQFRITGETTLPD
ncbi:MAG TPA: glycoside hydrolase family 3 C-terminal domain-containing protein [Candidatus Acidoferrum sp.]|nr:glycoside hydrolase family 3 C-terminal domain-containing protein [Candidatus Acidoferrum sp.]